VNASDPVADLAMMNLSEAARVLPGRLIGADVGIRGVTIDSRRVKPSDVPMRKTPQMPNARNSSCSPPSTTSKLNPVKRRIRIAVSS